ncbi:MAG: PAS domain-containing sensor histidine kinase [Candidatus Hydrogenedentota bacterium]|nr:MAG: PAS domain-containing sensor histidine kinase [Candidatus Hydrogenedentota bacterium]
MTPFRRKRRGEILLVLHRFRITLAEEEEEEEEVVILEDVTDQRSLFEELMRSRESFTNVVDRAADGIVVLSPEFEVLYFNDAALELLGVEPREWPAFFDRAGLKPDSTTECAHLHPRHGERFLEFVCGRTQWQEKPALLMTIRDVSDRKALVDELRQAQKMESIGRLAGGIAHDFNNILTVLQNEAELIEEAAQDSDVADHAREIGEVARRASDLTRRLLAFGRRQLLNPVPVEINSLLHDLSRLIRRLLPEGIKVRIESGPEDLWVRADPNQIEHVFINLSINARDAMPSGGRLTFSTAREELDTPRRGPDGPIPPGAYALIRVSDTGIGMDRETLARIFEPFFTTKASGEGTGLGLSMVHGIIHQHNGFIECESRPGEGTTFTIRLPEIPAPESASPEPTLSAKDPDAVSKASVIDKKTILVVEDEEAVRRIIERILTNAGHAVLLASSLKEARERLDADAGRLDLIFSDISLPDGAGTELLAFLKERGFAMPVLFTSGYTEREFFESVRESKNVHFLHKPFTSKALLQKLAVIDTGCRE